MKSPIAGLLLACALAGCAAPRVSPDEAGVSARAPAVFYDATGKRVLVDVSAPPDAPKPAPAPAAGPSPAAGPDAGADAVTQDARQFQGEAYRTDTEVDQELATRRDDRFYIVPDVGPGVVPGKLTAGQLGIDPDKPPSPPDTGPVPTGHFLACAEPVRLDGLVGGPVRGREASLDFPVRMDDGIRPGYALLFRKPLSRVNVWSVVHGGPPVDVVVALLDASNRVRLVVNNFATESIPDSLFRYGKVGGSIDLGAAPWPVAGVAVLDAAEAARRLPPECRPPIPATPVGKGRVMVTWHVAESSKR